MAETGIASAFVQWRLNAESGLDAMSRTSYAPNTIEVVLRQVALLIHNAQKHGLDDKPVAEQVIAYTQKRERQRFLEMGKIGIAALSPLRARERGYSARIASPRGAPSRSSVLRAIKNGRATRQEIAEAVGFDDMDTISRHVSRYAGAGYCCEAGHVRWALTEKGKAEAKEKSP